MVALHQVAVPRRPIAELAEVIGLDRVTRLLGTAAEFHRRTAGRTIWNLSSTATGGGVAEMLQGLVGYTKDLGVDIRWSVIGGDADFFRITKRLHNLLHGQPGDGGPLGAAEADHYRAVLRDNATALAAEIRRDDLVLLHDPQTAGLADLLARRGARVVWRCHIGAEHENEFSRAGWEFLRPALDAAEAYVFSRRSYAPGFVPADQLWIIPPSIDPYSPKNQPMAPESVRAILAHIGVLDGGSTPALCRFVRRDGAPGEVTRVASVAAEALPGPDEPMILQVSRWDRLKDMPGVMRGFSQAVAPSGPGWLVLAGPAVDGVTDDPEGALVFAECLDQWHRLPTAARSRVVLATLPMADGDENAAIVNALQRQASVIVQKSLAEGFGLTVAEGMWKGRPVVASAVGGIPDQIVSGTGVLLADPADLNTFGRAVRGLLTDPATADRLGRAAREHVRADFVGDLHLLRYAALFAALLDGR